MLAARAARENAQQGVKGHDRLYNEGKVKLRSKHSRNQSFAEEDFRKTSIRINKFETSPSRNDLYQSVSGAYPHDQSSGLLSPPEQEGTNRSSSVKASRNKYATEQ